MTASGQSRRFGRVPVTSGLPPVNGHRQTGPVGPFRAKGRQISSGTERARSRAQSEQLRERN